MASSRQEILLSELGPILKHYAELMRYLDTDTLWRWYSEERKGESLSTDQWQLASNREDFGKRLEALYEGKINEAYPLRSLQQLLRTFNDPDVTTDMPGLMAEWLEAIEMEATLIRLCLKTDFDSPSWGSDQKGKNATYKNARMRLNGFECAFVTVRLERNETEFTSCEQLSNHPRDEFDS